MRRLALFWLAATALAGPAQAATLVVYAADSLREALAPIATAFTAAGHDSVDLRFEPPGRTRERIEAGEHVDLIMANDTASARALVEQGRASLLVVFTRNPICLLSSAKFAATTDTLVGKVTAPGARIGVANAKIDPLGEYSSRLFDLVDGLQPGGTALIRANAVELAPSSEESGDAVGTAMREGRVDAALVYCSTKQRYAAMLPTARMVSFPPDLRLSPRNAMALMKNAQPDATSFALTIMSADGQKALAAAGFRPAGLPGD